MGGTRVASNLGWRDIAALTVGDKVLTFDNGMQPITQVHCVAAWMDAPYSPPAAWPVVVPAEALGNRTPMHLLPEQTIMVECDAAFDRVGDPFAVLPAAALEGIRGIHRQRPKAPVELVALHFASDEVIYAEGGALIHCSRDMSTLDKFLDGAPPHYDVLDAREAAQIAQAMALEDSLIARRNFAA